MLKKIYIILILNIKFKFKLLLNNPKINITKITNNCIPNINLDYVGVKFLYINPLV